MAEGVVVFPMGRSVGLSWAYYYTRIVRRIHRNWKKLMLLEEKEKKKKSFIVYVLGYTEANV